MKWYRQAAEKGNDWAMWRIGIFYEKGYGVRRDITKAIDWYRRRERRYGAVSA